MPEYLYQRHLEVGDKVNLNFVVDEDEGPHEDLNDREVSEEASVSSEGQQEFDESSDEEVEVSADDNNSQGQQDQLGASTNFLFGARSRYGGIRSFRSMVRSFQVRSFHKMVCLFHKTTQFVPHMLYLFSKFVNVIRVQTSVRNMDESIFRTIYIMLRAPYVNFTMHCDVRTIHTMVRAYVCGINLFVDF